MSNSFKIYFSFSVFWILLLVSSSVFAQTLFKLLTPNETGISFRNDVIETNQVNIMLQGQVYAYNGGGVAVGDLDNDGLEDLVFTANSKSTLIYKNKGHLQFEDKTANAHVKINGWCTGVSMADVNNDGLLDIYICKSQYPDSTASGNQLLINYGNFLFKDETSKYGLTFNKNSIQGSFFDFDKDGDLDFYLLVHPIEVPTLGISIDITNQIPKIYGTDILYENLGADKGFVDATYKLGGSGENAFGLGIMTADFDNDGWEDIYVANDFVQQDFFFKNLGNGTFKECLYDHFAHTSYFSMGVDLNDINNDQLPDLFVADMSPASMVNYKQQLNSFNFNFYNSVVKNHGRQNIWNNFQLNNNSSWFSEIGNYAGISQTDWSWSPLMVDLDADGYKDLVVSNGIKRDVLNQEFYLYTLDSIRANVTNDNYWTDSTLLTYVRPYIAANQFYKNNRDLTFKSNANNWGINEVFNSNGAAYADLDLDGDIEIIFNNTDTFATIYDNQTNHTNTNYWIELKLKDDLQIPYGTKVILYQQNKIQSQFLTNTRGYQSKSSDILYFGLGNLDQIDSIKIFWNDFTQDNLISPRCNQLLIIDKSKTLNKTKNNVVASKSKLFHLYENNQYLNLFNNDFTVQPLLYKSISDVGIAATQLKESNKVFIGAFMKNKAHLIQNKNDSLIVEEINLVNYDSIAIQFCAIETDLNKDHIPEILIASGHLFSYLDTTNFKLEAFTLNHSSLIKNTTFKFPKLKSPISSIIPIDMDGDNDLDLFLAAAYSSDYPNYPTSYLLENKGQGVFVDVTKFYLPLNGQLGNIKKAITIDVNKDQLNDLVLVGEWMPIRLLIAQKSKPFMVEDIPNTNGLWQTLFVDSINDEKQIKIFVGNLGINSRFQKQVDVNQNNQLYASTQDLNGDGIIDPLIAVGDSLHNEPIYFYNDFIDYFPATRKKAFSYIPYSTASSKLLLPSFDYHKSLITKELNSGYWNISDTKKFIPLAKELQISSINAYFKLADNYLVTTGNQLDMRRDLGAIDASPIRIYNLNNNSQMNLLDLNIGKTNSQYIHIFKLDKYLIFIDKYGQIDAMNLDFIK